MSLAERLAWLRAHRSDSLARATLRALIEGVVEAGHTLEQAETLARRVLSALPGSDFDEEVVDWVRQGAPRLRPTVVAALLEALPVPRPPADLTHARRMASVRRVNRQLTEDLVAA